jgi:ectoine hydroxylase-related dioxygenase (phytanoyl-CoA dioxygenase family)
MGADRPWDVPRNGWHYDGIHFRHYVDSPDQGLLLLCLFSDIRHKGGGTFAVEGSHHLVARILKDHPEGLESREANQLSRQHPYIAELTGANEQSQEQPKDIYAEVEEAPAADLNRIDKFLNTTYHDPEGYSMRVIETTGAPGDAILCHPFLIHSPSQNHLRVPRFLCNRTTPLKERMNFNRPNLEDHSPLELSIRRSVFNK